MPPSGHESIFERLTGHQKCEVFGRGDLSAITLSEVGVSSHCTGKMRKHGAKDSRCGVVGSACPSLGLRCSECACLLTVGIHTVCELLQAYMYCAI